MKRETDKNYQRVALAIEYIRTHFKAQPSLDQIASAVNLSTFYFHRLFSDWAGVSPKQFLQYLSVEHAKYLLRQEQQTVLEAAHELGFSGPSRLHDLFVRIEALTPGEFKNGGEKLSINYRFSSSPFGQVMAASTRKGVCLLAFVEGEEKGLEMLAQAFPRARYRLGEDAFQENALRAFDPGIRSLATVKLHLHASDFQQKVWQTLLTLPAGTLSSYGDIAKKIGQPRAARAVGTAIGRNPIAFLIPCHRVIQANGQLGGYRWGSSRKLAMIGWEASSTGRSTV